MTTRSKITDSGGPVIASLWPFFAVSFVDCAAQIEVRTLIDALIASLDP